MNGIHFQYKFEPKQPHHALEGFTNLDPVLLLDPLGALITSQVEHRISSEKTGPDGQAWADNGGRNPILEASGGLRDSIHYVVSGNTVEVGSDKIYAAIQHFGGTIVPKKASHLVFQIGNRWVSSKSVTIRPRPYLGVSSSNAAQINATTSAILSRLIH